jgi:hypothetical protein
MGGSEEAPDVACVDLRADVADLPGSAEQVTDGGAGTASGPGGGTRRRTPRGHDRFLWVRGPRVPPASQSIAEGSTMKGSAGTLVRGARRRAADHLPRSPAGEQHQVLLLSAAREPRVRRMCRNRCGCTFCTPASAARRSRICRTPDGDPALLAEPGNGQLGLRVEGAGPQVAAERVGRLGAVGDGPAATPPAQDDRAGLVVVETSTVGPARSPARMPVSMSIRRASGRVRSSPPHPWWRRRGRRGRGAAPRRRVPRKRRARRRRRCR